MKSFLMFLIVFSMLSVGLVLSSPYFTAVSMPSTPTYARIKYNNALFYKTATLNSDNGNVYFLLEQSYFVELISDENTDFYKAKYLDLLGFVKKVEVECVTEDIETPYLNSITFNSNIAEIVNIRSLPSTDSETIYTLPANTNNVKYIGKISGQEAITSLGNIWYYCYYTALDIVYAGYVYAPLTSNLTSIIPNSVTATVTSINHFNSTNSFLSIKPNFRILLTFLTLIPIIFIVYLLFKKSEVTND
jgi:hypothetical protein